jgi:hypothetical protein
MKSMVRIAPRNATVLRGLLLAITSGASLHCGSDSSLGRSSAGSAPAVNDTGGGSEPVTGQGGASASGPALGNIGSVTNVGSSAGASSGASAGSAVDAGTRGSAGSGTNDAGTGTPTSAYDWNGVVGTGQSLSVGEPGSARNTPAGVARLTRQPFHNLKLATGALPWPIDSSDPTLTMVPLTEPIGRLAPAYPSSWPENMAFNGETPHSAMANQVTTLVSAAGGQDFVGVHGAVGENGQCLSFLVKGARQVGVNGRAYEATLIETRAITRLARAAGKNYGVAAITVTHGECDAANGEYADQLFALYTDYASDLPAISGQTQPPLMIVSQQNSTNDRSPSTLAAWRLGIDHPDRVVCSGPKYQYPYTSDAVHLLVEGYEALGEKYGQVYYERVILGNGWRPLQPTSFERTGRIITVHFHVPVPPLIWETTFQLPHQTSLTEWSAGRGFELRNGANRIAISTVEIVGDAVRITAGADLPATGVTIGYALTGDPTPMTTPFPGVVRWGALRDSDPFVGATTQRAQPNFAVAFELTVP